MQIASLVVIRIFQIDCLKITFLRAIETKTESLLPVMGANDSILGPVVSFPINSCLESVILS